MFPLGLRRRLLRPHRPRPRPGSGSGTMAGGDKTRRRNAEEEATKLRRQRLESDAGVRDRRKKKPRLDQQEENNRKGEKKSLITDARFASAQFDPRFQRMPKRESKVVIDSRFSRMFSDKNFATSSAPVDKRGKPKKGKEANPLLHYYLQQQQEEKDETELTRGERAEARTAERGSESESAEEEEEQSTSLGSDDESTSATDEEDYEDYDDDESIGSDICRILMADHEDTPLTDNETRRLAVVNMDWDHIKAVDIYVVMSSCLPKSGQILSVAVYPSEFGLKCMEVEAVRGPAGLFEDTEEHSDEDSDNEKKKLRKYEVNKLRYYFAVVVCDSSDTANHLYNALDGSELLKTSNVFDLRFIPDSMEFKHPPRDITTEAPTGYKVPDFYTQALQHSNVKLTWEEDEPQRKKVLRRKFNPNQLDELELNEYIASTDDSDEEGDDDRESSAAESDGAGDLPNDEAKKDAKREKMRALLLSGDDSDASNSDDKDMEITFNTDLEDLGKRMLEKKDKKSETLWEAVLRRRREKKQGRRTRSKYSSEEDSSDSDVQEAPDQQDDFFDEESVGTDGKVTKEKSLSATKGKGSRKVRKLSPEKEREHEASIAELELLLADDQGAEHGPKGYNLKPKKVKGKKGKEKPSDVKLPDVNISDDPRFSALLTSHLYALDPTDPQYKRSAVYVRQRSQKQQAGERGEATRGEAENQHEQIPSASDDRIHGKDDVLRPTRVSLEKEKNEFSSTVRSLKRNLGALVNDSKGT